MGMTREEKEQTGKYVLQIARLLENGCYHQEILLKAVHIIDEALEQEPVLDKIQEEIKRVDTVCHASNNHDELIRRNVVLQIIDKYKAEEAEAYPVNENIVKGFEEYQKYLTNPPIPFGGYQPKTMSDDEIKEQINKEADRCMKILGRMTREEAKEFGNMWLQINEDCKDSSTYAFFQMAIKALEQEPCEDAISRQEVLYLIANDDLSMGQVVRGIHALPPVIPQEPRCKECKWWKDSDGEYRRGCGAESKCPINTHEVYCGEGYCYMFSSKADNKEIAEEQEDGNDD